MPTRRTRSGPGMSVDVDDHDQLSRHGNARPARAPAARSARDQIYRSRYLIAFAVTLASVLELVDTSIVNVAIPHMMGNLGATLDEVAWVSTGYIVANVIVLPLTSWLSDRFGRRNYYTGSILLFTLASFFCGNAHVARGAGVLARDPGHRRRRAHQHGAGDPVRRLPARGARHRHGHLRHGRDGRARPWARPSAAGSPTTTRWPWIFYINIPLGILAALLTWRIVPEPEHAVPHRRPGGLARAGAS